MMKNIFLIGILIFISQETLANSDQSKLHYYFLRASLVGQSPFAKSLSDFRKRYDDIKKNGDGFPSIYEQAQQSIEYSPKGAGPSNGELFSDFKILSEGTVPSTGKIFKRLTFWTTASKFLMSGSMKSPRAYETLSMNSAQELEEMRNNIIFFVSQQNAGNLSEKEQKALDLLFQYYTGVPTSLTSEQIMEDPLMLPIKEAKKVENVLKEQMSKDLNNLNNVNKKTKDILTLLTIEIQTQETREQLVEATEKVNQASSFEEVDKVIKSLGQIICQGPEAKACEDSKLRTMDLGDARKDLISRKEFEAGITAGIELGLAIGSITKNEELTKGFKALDAVNKAYKSVSDGMAAFSAASTSMGAFAAVAGAATGVIGAVAIVASLTMDSGGSADEAILAALQELKEMIIDLSRQIESGFKNLEVRSERIESLLISYSNLTSKNQAVIQQEIVSLSQDIEKGLQPLKFIELSYAQKQYEQFANLASQSYKISFALPSDPQKSISTSTKDDFRGLLGDLFSIIAAVENGEYKINISGEDAIEAHFKVINEMATYPASRFRTAFLVQNAINASDNVACGDVNLIGYIMTSEAAAQINQLVDKMSHHQLDDFFNGSENFNKVDFKIALEEAYSFLGKQRRVLNTCISKGFFEDFEKQQLTQTLALLDSQVDQFFSDGKRLNDMLTILQSGFNIPGGFSKDNFFAGELIKQTYSFDPVIWEKQNTVQPRLQSVHYMGDASVSMSRADMEAIFPSYEMRLAHLLGADWQMYFDSWWQTNDYGVVINIVLANPRNQKLINIWQGNIKKEFLKSEQFEIAPKGKWAQAFKLKPNMLPEIDKQIADVGGWRSVIFWHMQNPTPYNIEAAKNICTQDYGFLNCAKFSGSPMQPVFDANIFYQYPLNQENIGPDLSPVTNLNRLSLMEAQRFNQDWVKEYTQGIAAYVRQLKEISVGYLSPCLEGLVQGSALSCTIEGQENLFVSRHRDMLRIQNHNLIRMTLDANSSETQRIMDLSDLSRISRIEVPESPDAVIRRIELFREELVKRVDELDKSEPKGDVELPTEIQDLMDNNFYWFNDRLQPFLAG